MTKASQTSGEQLRPYLPAPLIRAWAEDPSRGAVWGQVVGGSLMHCDVTGFTAMSERLAERGKEGAEVMVEVLNQFFTRMLGIADGWDGEQMKFGGDAMLLLFSRREHAISAAACALEMQRAMREFKSVRGGGETHGLKMRVGIHSGRFLLASVGDQDNLLHLLITGPDVNRTAEVEPAASPGQVALSAETAGEMAGQCRVAALGDGLFRLAGVSLPNVRPAASSAARLSKELARYVHPAIRERALQGEVVFGEHRRATVMFINLLGLSDIVAAGEEGAAVEAANRYFGILLDALAAHGGFLLGSDASEHGDKVFALFGAPISQAKPEEAALLCALALDAGLRQADLRLRHRIGVNSGFVFAGEIGSRERREYTVIGDAVNLSARLMTAARWGEIVVSEETLETAGMGFTAQRMRPLRVKGKAAPVRAARLIGGLAAGTARTPPDSALVGRAVELGRLLRFSKARRRKRPVWAYVSGEAGIGKTWLLREFEARLKQDEWRVLAGQSHAHTSHVPFGAWNAVLRALFEMSPGDGFERFEKALASLAPGHAGSAGLVGRLLSLRGLPPEDVQSDAEAVRQKIKDALVAAISGAAIRERTLIVFEDAHWMDAPSVDLLQDVIQRATGSLVVLLSSREATPPRELRSPDLTVALAPLEPDAAREIVAAAGGLDESQIDSVIERSGGNPLLLSAFARSVTKAGLPETVEDAITSRVDVLPASLKAVVRAASVAGPTFDTAVIAGLLPAGRQRLDASMRELVEAGIARAEPGTGAYSFSHSVIREVVYEMLPYSHRRRMHLQMAEHIESTRADQMEAACEELLHHSELAEDTPRTIRYACISGDRAARIYEGEAAISYYNRALGSLAAASSRASGDRSVLLERVGDSLEVMGRHRDAAAMYEESLDEWESGETPRLRYVPTARVDGARLSELCRKTGVSMERGAEFEGSLHWLDRALAALPAGKPRLGAQICAARSVSLFRFGRYEEGVEWGRRALSMARRSRDRKQIAYSHNMLANSYMEQGDLKKAVRHLKQSVRIYHEIADFPGQASANNNLGMCYHLQGTLDAALYYYQVALQTDQRVGDLTDAMIVRSNIGEVLMTLGRLQEAMGYLDEVVAANQQRGGLTGVAGLARVNLSRCHLAAGALAAAAKQLRAGKRLLNEVGQAGLAAEAELQRSELTLAEGRPDLSAAAARAGLAQARALGARLLEGRGKRNLGEALAAMGRIEEAGALIKDSVAIARRIEATHEEARSLVALARLTARQGKRHARITACLRRAERIFGRMGARREAQEARRLLSEVTA